MIDEIKKTSAGDELTLERLLAYCRDEIEDAAERGRIERILEQDAYWRAQRESLRFYRLERDAAVSDAKALRSFQPSEACAEVARMDDGQRCEIEEGTELDGHVNDCSFCRRLVRRAFSRAEAARHGREGLMVLDMLLLEPLCGAELDRIEAILQAEAKSEGASAASGAASAARPTGRRADGAQQTIDLELMITTPTDELTAALTSKDGGLSDSVPIGCEATIMPEFVSFGNAAFTETVELLPFSLVMSANAPALDVAKSLIAWLRPMGVIAFRIGSIEIDLTQDDMICTDEAKDAIAEAAEENEAEDG